MKPKLVEVQVVVHTNEGITYTTWYNDKKTRKLLHQDGDVMKWFDNLIRQCKEHYPEEMGK